MIGDDLLDRHARSQELQKTLDRVAQATDRGLPVADIRDSGDAIQP